ncbi:hypothetical protein Syun_025686 [Stephania yunnanensis]|uniref:Uncharacterized protein n=1 Tax=Stephania yunnanensis TaxID=152371 RepID=A0AAP0HW01_9MAGN
MSGGSTLMLVTKPETKRLNNGFIGGSKGATKLRSALQLQFLSMASARMLSRHSQQALFSIAKFNKPYFHALLQCGSERRDSGGGRVELAGVRGERRRE